MKKQIVFELLIFTLLIVGLIVAAGKVSPARQAGGVAHLTPTSEQTKDLQLAQKDAIIAQQKMQIIQSAQQAATKEYNDAIAALNAAADKVKSANKWDERTSFDPQTLAFIAPPPKKAETPAPAAKP